MRSVLVLSLVAAAAALPTPMDADLSFLNGLQKGEGTWHEIGLGACGITNTNDDSVVSVSHRVFDNYPGFKAGDDPKKNPVCNKKIRATYNGTDVEVAVTDRCEDCELTDLSFSPAAFDSLAKPAKARTRLRGMTWEWIDGHAIPAAVRLQINPLPRQEPPPTDESPSPPTDDPPPPTEEPPVPPNDQPPPNDEPPAPPNDQPPPNDEPPVPPNDQPPPNDEPPAPPTDQPPPPTDEPPAPPTDQPPAPPTDQPPPPTDQPPAPPTDSPSGSPTDSPSGSPSDNPNSSPTVEPPATPTGEPPATPTSEPPASPTGEPPATSTSEPPPVLPPGAPPATPTGEPPASPTGEPPATPTGEPPAAPTSEPPASPTVETPAPPTGEPPASTTSDPPVLPPILPPGAPPPAPTGKPPAPPPKDPKNSPKDEPPAPPPKDPKDSPKDEPPAPPPDDPKDSPTDKPPAPPPDDPKGSPSNEPTPPPTDNASGTSTSTDQSTSSSTEKPSGTPAGGADGAIPSDSPPTTSSCKARKKRTLEQGLASVAKRALHRVLSIFSRADNDPEFIGFYGTNSKTAEFWGGQGFISKPPSTKGILDFIGLGSTQGTSGAAAELGPGLYVNPGTTPKVCAIFAKAEGNWRNVVPKAFFPDRIVKDSADATKAKAFEDARLDYVGRVLPNVQATSTVKFSLLDQTQKIGQLLLPEPITSLFSATCFDYSGLLEDLPPNTKHFPEFSYDSQTLRSQWKIAPEDNAAADCVNVQ